MKNKQLSVIAYTLSDEHLPIVVTSDDINRSISNVDNILISYRKYHINRLVDLLGAFTPNEMFIDIGAVINVDNSREEKSYPAFFSKTLTLVQEDNGNTKQVNRVDLSVPVWANNQQAFIVSASIIPNTQTGKNDIVTPEENAEIDPRGHCIVGAVYAFLEANYQALHYADNLEELPEKVYHYKQDKRGKNGKKRTKSVIYKSRQFRINKVVDDDYIPTPRKPIQRKTESWGVCGHYRHYKNGKVVFVRAHIKGKRDEIKPHIYSISVGGGAAM